MQLISEPLPLAQAQALETSLIGQALAEGRLVYNIAEASISPGAGDLDCAHRGTKSESSQPRTVFPEVAMGWWKVEGTRSVIGDVPLDTLGAAVADVVELYESAFNRRPTKEEWEALLLAVLGASEEESRACNDGIPAKVTLSMSAT